MRDLAFVGFLFAILGLGFRRPFLFVLAYAYIDIVSPQKLTYLLLNSIPISMIVAGLAVLSWLAVDDKAQSRIAPRQGLLLLLLVYCGMTLGWAAYPVDAGFKWDWVWKALAFAIFLPLTLRTKLRMEALALFMVLSAASIIIIGGIKTAASGGGYGALNLMVDSNSGLYEGSTLSTVAVAIIPLILFLMRFGTIFKPGWRVKMFALALCFACLLIPVGTEARTGLICIAVLAVLSLRDAKRRGLYIMGVVAAGLIAMPLLPKSFTERMDTIKTYQADSSASTRIAVWQWTWEFAKEHPFGGGFEAYRANKLRIDKVTTEAAGETRQTVITPEYDQARAYHSAYFEMLGEQGYPGLAIWLLIQVIGLVRMEKLRRRYKDAAPEDAWVRPLATALQHGQVVYLVGALFVAIAIQTFVLMMIALQIGLDTYLARRERERAWRPLAFTRTKRTPQPA